MQCAGDALIAGTESVVAERRPAPQRSATGPAGRLNHGLQGSRVKAHTRTTPDFFPKSALRDAWAGFLSPYAFQWFATLTFESNVHPEAALKRWRRFTNEINRKLYGRRWMQRPNGGLHWVAAIERQKRGVVHLHALLGDDRDLNLIARRLSWMDYWHSIAGFARIEAIRSDDAVVRYVTKYVIKDGDIEFSRNLGKSVQPQLFGPAK